MGQQNGCTKFRKFVYVWSYHDNCIEKLWI